MSLAISTTDLKKSYGDVQALDGLSLSVERGEFFGLLGPNGAGKTTFINVLVGLVRKSGGEASVFGHDVEDEYREARDRIGLAPQEFNVDRFFPIREVLIHKAGYHGISTEEAGERADEALQTVGIYDKRETRFDWLSGGMKRRFMLARALVSDPDLLILDEPTAGVDVELRRDLWEIITELNDDGTTILLTTHYIEEAERLCDEVAIMDSGRKVTVASPDELMARGNDTIRLQLRESPARVPAIDNERVESLDLDGDTLVVTAPQGGEVSPDLIRQLDRQGHTVVDIDISRTSLEEVFVELTRRDETGETNQADPADETESPEASI
ncbi:ABC transporter ATP-binding protein [Halococcus saccharolyticus]|uniref:ABC transporter ATP-binding protein n=1 Tax=Halococcus saccharolyticus DSM 5350 TaxID=1227455 RepID=M0ME56_9EURY|nr:ABC transporter ATP-binding protein [Halococcus saccharolyticus]EMA44037.1 ABC transporter ATP-binding protein [Halococcus saccharolyticus DSM 5350]